MNKQRYLEIRNQVNFQKRLSKLILHFAIDFGLTLTIAVLQWTGHLVLSIPLISALMFRNFGLMHDATHGAVHDNRDLNDAVGLWAGALCLLPFEPWKKSHLQHHLWSGNIEKDPVMALRLSLPKMNPSFVRFLSFLWQKWIPILGTLQNILFWVLSLRHWSQEKTLKRGLSLLLPLTVWGLVFAALPWQSFFLAFLPALFFYYLLNEIVNLPHHLQLPMVRGETRYHAWEQYKTARSCIYPKWFARGVVLHFNYHAAHHMFPDAPWYYLEDLSAQIDHELGSAHQTDLSLNWILQNRPLDLVQVITADQIKEAA